MAFNLYFAGSKTRGVEERIWENNSPRLFSYLHEKKQILERTEKGFKTFVDSGAYSAHTKGKEIDIDHYIGWLNEHDEGVDIAAELDHIPGVFRKPKTPAQLAEAPIISWDNYLYMIERVKNWEKILPIFHQGEDFKYLEQMLEHKPTIPYIGISPANDLPVVRKIVWIDKVFKIIKQSSNPNVKTHAFGMTSLHVLEQYPFYSADSTSWIMTAANGGIMTEFGVKVVSSKATKDRKHVKHLPKPQYNKFLEYLDSKGYTLEGLGDSHIDRMRFNIDYLTDWANNYVYKPKTLLQGRLF